MLSANTVAQKPGDRVRLPLSPEHVLATAGLELDWACSAGAVANAAAIAISETDAKAAARIPRPALRDFPIPALIMVRSLGVLCRSDSFLDGFLGRLLARLFSSPSC